MIYARRLREPVKAIICPRYGAPDVLHLEEVDKPTPKDNEVLIRVHAATVTAGDCELRSLEVSFLLQLLLRIGFGFRGPRRRILGQDLAGEIELVGKDVKLFKKGDQVFANTGFFLGAWAEYDSIPEKGLIATKPANMTYEEAASVPLGGLQALHYLRKANIQTGQKVLINGAGGTVGNLAVQMAKSFGAEVTAVDSTEKLDILRSIGADHSIDYTKEDFTKSGETYDVIIDPIGKISILGCVKSLKEKGSFLGGPGLSRLIQWLWISLTSNKKVIIWTGTFETQDLIIIKELIEAGKIKSVIDRRYPLEQIAEAHRYVDTGQKKGNVVITVAHPN